MKILLAEDDHFFQKFYSMKLREQPGFEVDIAGDGDEALAKINENKPDFILLDLVMPKKDGFSVLEALSENESYKTIPVLVFSTLGQEADIQRAMTLGAQGYVNKTFYNFDTLITRIESLTQKK